MEASLPNVDHRNSRPQMEVSEPPIINVDEPPVVDVDDGDDDGQSILEAHQSHMASSSNSEIYHTVDDLYFCALHDNDEIFPISDEKYAEELQLQEALMSSASLTITSFKQDPSSSFPSTSTSTPPHTMNTKQPLLPPQLSVSFCHICMDSKPQSEMFSNTTVCRHLFCSDCIRGHVSAKIQENIAMVRCPDPKCEGVIGPEHCQSIVPKEVIERWEDALCESLIVGTQKFYCPFKDCLAMLVDDGGEAVTSSECPNCNRLFCAQCKVAWHSELICSEYKSLKDYERNPEDIMLVELAKDKKWRRCPSCKYYVEKNEGCLHIACRCGYHFCYGCGKEYNSSHACHLQELSA